MSDEIAQLVDVVRLILLYDQEAPGHGMADCIDNHGKHYQSAALANALKLAGSLAEQIADMRPVR